MKAQERLQGIDKESANVLSIDGTNELQKENGKSARPSSSQRFRILFNHFKGSSAMSMPLSLILEEQLGCLRSERRDGGLLEEEEEEAGGEEDEEEEERGVMLFIQYKVRANDAMKHFFPLMSKTIGFGLPVFLPRQSSLPLLLSFFAPSHATLQSHLRATISFRNETQNRLLVQTGINAESSSWVLIGRGVFTISIDGGGEMCRSVVLVPQRAGGLRLPTLSVSYCRESPQFIAHSDPYPHSIPFAHRHSQVHPPPHPSAARLPTHLEAPPIEGAWAALPPAALAPPKLVFVGAR
eukprot:GHVT01088589.1.p1 GENE.GHVT01088589.1~~GHVT01088589.1.p1  ORF type:complete len:296 (+),score=46.80 GHVT01088589.1:521-1408(+)